MSVESTATYTSLLFGNGVTTAFPFTFKAMGEDEVGALGYNEDGEDVTLSSFTVTLTDTGGTATFATAPASGISLRLYSTPDVGGADGAGYRDEHGALPRRAGGDHAPRQPSL